MHLFHVLAFVIVLVSNLKVSIQDHHSINAFDCSDKADGNYPHPNDCSKFITCSGGVASEHQCPNCDPDPEQCPNGRLVYDPEKDQCVWASDFHCKTGGYGDYKHEQSGYY